MADSRWQNDWLWWQRGVLYQIYPRSSKDTTGNGIGDLPGVIEELDYLAWLGVDAIWLSPFYPSPMVDFGYDVTDYTDVDPLFGDLSAFDRLIQEAHRRGLRIILDFVPNHTSDQHPWFLESRSSRDNPKRDWYIWRDPAPDGGVPNNWVSVFGGTVWGWDEKTGQYYLHSFLPEQADLNWRNPEVVEAMHDVLRFWLDRGADGFRVDAIHYVMKDAEFRDNPPARSGEGRVKGLGPFDQLEHLHDLDQPEVHDVIRGLRAVVDSYDGRLLIGETFIREVSTLTRYYGTDLVGLQIPFNFRLMHSDCNAGAYRASVDEYEAGLPPGGWPNYLLNSHDEHRIVSRCGLAQARISAMALLTLRGTPTLYYGEEIGMADGDIPPDKVQDPFGVRVPGHDLGRDPERTPMQWNAGSYAGFSVVEPWLPVSPDYPETNVAVQREDPASMLSLYRRLIEYRRATPALAVGSYRSVDAPDACYVYLREYKGQRIVVALNFSEHERTLSLPELGVGRVVLSTHLDREEPADMAAFGLRGMEGCVVALEG